MRSICGRSDRLSIWRDGPRSGYTPTQWFRVTANPVNSIVLRFGAYEFDPQAGELRKQGIRIRLEGQPLAILRMLLDRPGKLVTREDLQKTLWPENTFVDFEHSLNAAIKRLRGALNNSANAPRYVETLAGRGYRFIGTVNGAEPASVAEAKPTRKSRSLIFPAAVGLLAVLGITAALLGLNVHGWRDRFFVHAAKPRIQALAVLPLTNLSGDPEQEYFADGMTEEIITKLGEVGAPRVISRQSVVQYKGSKKPLQEIARELNVDAVLEGAVERSGNRV